MLEVPESATIEKQAKSILIGKTIAKIVPATSLHSFTWYSGNPADYSKLLNGRKIESVHGHGALVDMHCSDNICITIGDGTNMRYYEAGSEHPKKHQMLIEFADGSFVAFAVSMYGSIYAYEGKLDNFYHQVSLKKPSPLHSDFNQTYFDNVVKEVKKNISVKALLATDQRIPGLGNGVLQDILYNARINPKRKTATLSDSDKDSLYKSVKETLKSMAENNGRDTEKDFFGNNGGYKTILSKNTYKSPCLNCGDVLKKEAYLGGSVYYCPTCQAL